MATGWAYINCTASAVGGASATGPTGSLQFHTSGSNQTGSAKLIYYTSSITVDGHLFPASSLVYTGTLYVHGAITASGYHIDQRTITSGSTYFGNSADDVHVRTGSLSVMSGTLEALAGEIAPILTASTLNRRVYVHALAGRYQAISADITASAALNSDNQALIYGFTATTPVASPFKVGLRLLAPSIVGAGTVIVVKDQIPNRVVADRLTISGSGAGDTIDGSSYYQLTGNMPAINLYSDGTNWFVF